MSPLWTSELVLPEELRALQVRAWLARADQASLNLSALPALLAPEELARAARFAVDPARRLFILTRATLRMLLGRELGVDPQTLQFHYSPEGKPSLHPSHGVLDLHFNVSHSGELALLALARGLRVGVDLERIEDQPDIDAIAGAFFAKAERELLQQKAPAQRKDTFYRIWARKEAILKASGAGIAAGLREPDVSGLSASAAGQIAGIVKFRINSWLLHDLSPDPCYAAALALEAP